MKSLSACIGDEKNNLDQNRCVELSGDFRIKSTQDHPLKPKKYDLLDRTGL